MYSNPNAHLMATGGRLTKEQVDEQEQKFQDFYIDIFDELAKYGHIEELHVCENLTDHLVGNVYLRYSDEENAAEALKYCTGRYYGGRLLQPEYCVVTDFDQARCRQYDERNCGRGGYCNFLHMKEVPRPVLRDLLSHQPNRPLDEQRKRSRSRSSSSGSSRSSSSGSRSSRSYSSDSRSSRSRSNSRDRRDHKSSSYHHHSTSRSNRDRSRSRERAPPARR